MQVSREMTEHDSELTVAAAFLLGIAASGHCLVMCGGISSALGLATAKAANGRPRWNLLLSYQLGRVSSYALAGLLLAGAFGGVVALLDLDLGAGKPCVSYRR